MLIDHTSDKFITYFNSSTGGLSDFLDPDALIPNNTAPKLVLQGDLLDSCHIPISPRVHGEGVLDDETS